MKKDILLKYNVTAEGLINRHGKISNAIMLKAKKFLNDKRIVYDISFFNSNGISTDRYVCLPLKNYNCTAYTLLIKTINDTKHISCNCQYATMTNKMCSHALALSIKTGLSHRVIRFDGGVR